MSMAGPLGGAGARDPVAPTINAKKYRRWALGGGVGDPRAPSINAKKRRGGNQKVCCDLHRHDRQKVILLIDPIFHAVSSVMPDDP
jgi:hypothetical protein